MNLYAFILGRKNLLSTAELCNVLKKDARIIDIQQESLIADLKTPLLPPQESLNRLGGTIKIVEIFTETSLDEENLSPAISKYLIDEFKDQSDKLTYGLSAYNFSQTNEEILKHTLNIVKKNLTDNGIKGRYINKDYQNPKSVAIKSEGLIQKGSEIVIIKGTHKYFFGITKAIQDYEAYSQRDYEKPARDPKLGMLPPKLAQIMINLGGFTNIHPPDEFKDTHHLLYDPFAGTGTILTEGLILNYSVAGSDISSQVIEKANKNINWTKAHLNTFKQTVRLFQQDATILKPNDVTPPPDIIVTESYLGPAVTFLPDITTIKKNLNYVEELLFRFFKNLQPLIKKNTPIIISMPIYLDKSVTHPIKNLPQRITNLGYKITPLIPKEISTKFNLPQTERPSLIYDRPDQNVGREIFKIIRT